MPDTPVSAPIRHWAIRSIGSDQSWFDARIGVWNFHPGEIYSSTSRARSAADEWRVKEYLVVQVERQGGRWVRVKD